MGEFGLIELIHTSIARRCDMRSTAWQEVIVGIGDDAAAWQSADETQLATTDTMVQDIHFNPDIISWEELGWKALAVNLSDIAAMGGIPKYALLSLSLPGDLDVEAISQFCDGMVGLAKQFGVAMIGGNVSASPNVVITLTLIGCCEDGRMLRRSTASPGELIAVTGCLGTSAAGLEMLSSKAVPDRETATVLRQSHVKPTPRIAEGQILVEQGVKTAIDISDGLVNDLDHVCQSSRVNARIEAELLPVHSAVAVLFPNHLDLALCGGEDYELLFTADEATTARVKLALACPVTVIGKITEEKPATRVTVVNTQGELITCSKGGWEHFRNEFANTGFTQP